MFTQLIRRGVKVRQDPGTTSVQPETWVLLRVTLFETLGDRLRSAFMVRCIGRVEHNVCCGSFASEKLGVVETTYHDTEGRIGVANFGGFVFGADEGGVFVFGMFLLEGVEGVAGDVAGYAGAAWLC
jgi:hypothetical protein